MEGFSNYVDRQKNRTIHHPMLSQSVERSNGAFSFVISADTQLGMADRNFAPTFREIEYSKRAIKAINSISPRPLFCCVCGDLVDMNPDMFAGKEKPNGDKWTREECETVQRKQFDAFQETWNNLHPDIALVCLCGNHDVGNQPTETSIKRFTDRFGDDYLSFWANHTFHIVINSSLISDPEGAQDRYNRQFSWLTEQLEFATKNKASHIFVHGHHPWFLYDSKDDETQLQGRIYAWPPEWGDKPNDFNGFPESYFPIPRERRLPYLDLFEKYRVSACFAGHFHQNLVSKTEFGTEMIITGPLSLVLPSSGNKSCDEPFSLGFRLVSIGNNENGIKPSFTHQFIPLDDTVVNNVKD